MPTGGATESGTPAKILLDQGVLEQHMADHPQSHRRIQGEMQDVSLLSGSITKKPAVIKPLRRPSSRVGVKPQPSWGRARYALIRTVDLEDQAVRGSTLLIRTKSGLVEDRMQLTTCAFATGHDKSHWAKGLTIYPPY